MTHRPAAGNSGAARGVGGLPGLQDIASPGRAAKCRTLRMGLAQSGSAVSGFQGLCSLRPEA